MPTTTSAIRLRSVSKEFRTGGTDLTAVDAIDLDVPRGQVLAFLGPNGAGKTTTLDMILGLTAPTAGTIEVLGVTPREAVRSGKISAVLQSGGLLRDLTVGETVRLIASTYPAGISPNEALGRAGLDGVASRKVSKCSGGEQQRLRFALALLPDPELLILDEPTTGMDVTARAEFWDAMYAEAARGRTVIFATHYLTEADAFAQRIIMMAGGRVVADGTTHEIRSLAAGRTVAASFTGAIPVEELRARPGTTSVVAQGRRVTIRTTDSDALAADLLSHLGGYDLEITPASLDQVFTTLTASTTNPTGDPR